MKKGRKKGRGGRVGKNDRMRESDDDREKK